MLGFWNEQKKSEHIVFSNGECYSKVKSYLPPLNSICLRI